MYPFKGDLCSKCGRNAKEGSSSESEICFICLTKLDDESYKYNLSTHQYVKKENYEETTS